MDIPAPMPAPMLDTCILRALGIPDGEAKPQSLTITPVGNSFLIEWHSELIATHEQLAAILSAATAALHDSES